MSFRSALLASAAILTAGTAFAADLPARVAAPAPYIAAPIFTWTGFYVGLNAGAGWNNTNDWNTFGYARNVSGSTGNNDAGFTGGAQAGYNMQFGSFVAGVEGDINYIDRSNSGSFTVSNTTLNNGVVTAGSVTVNSGDSNNWFGTLRGRLGFAFDRALIFATGGLAFGGNHGGGSVVDSAGRVFTSTGGSSNNVGWALGGGMEYAFSNAWSVKVEYLHVDLGSHNLTFRDPTLTTAGFNVSNDNKFDIVRAGINYRF